MDAVLGVDPQVTPSQDNSHVLDVTYADDTLLISSSRCSTQMYLNTLIEMAEPYGLQPNWDKTLHLRTGHAEELFGPQGELLKTANQAVYLGALLTDTGRAATSLARRIGEARGAFNKLCAVWRHANINKYKKIKIFKACIVSKLLYSLESECLLLADRRRLDGFYCRCLREIQGIPHSMLSHITNLEVLRRASEKPLTSTLQRQQLLLFGRVATLPADSVIRRVVFNDDSVVPLQIAGRKRGRPRITWSNTLYALALSACSHDAGTLQNLLCGPGSNFDRWKGYVNEYVAR